MMPILLDIALKGSVLIAVAAGLTMLGRRTTAAHRHFVWALSLGGLLALPLLSAALPWRLPVVPLLSVVPRTPAPDPSPAVAAAMPDELLRRAVAEQRAVASMKAEADARAAVALEAQARVAAAAAASPLHTPPASAAWYPSLGTVLRALWILGAGLVLARLFAGMLALRWLLRDARDVSDREWLELLASTQERLDIRATVRLVESPRTRMPMAFGVWRPVVALPPGADEWPADLRETVLLHELAHVRRGDVRANLLGQLACALYWFHPLVWRAARRLRIEAERACDDLVLASGAAASDYASHLLEMVQVSAFGRAPAMALPMAQPSAFEGRVLAILDPRLARNGLTTRAAVFGILSLFAVTVPLAALSPVQQEPSSRARRDAEREARVRVREADIERSVAQSMERQSEAMARDIALRTEIATRNHVTVTTSTGTNTITVSNLTMAQRAERDAERQAERELGDHGQARNPAVTVALMEALSDSLEDVRLSAAHALGERGDTAAINALLAALRRDTSKDVRKTAAWALGQIEDARAVTGLVAAMQSESDKDVRNTCVWALGQIENAAAVEGLGALLRREQDPEVRRSIVWAFGQIESVDAVPYLTTVTRDTDPALRSKVAWAFGQIENAAAIEPLMAMFAAERVSSVRETIVWALGQIEDARAVPVLETALRDTSLAVRRKAVWAYGEIDGIHTAPAGLVAAVRDSDTEVRREATRALGEIQDPATVPALVAAMHDGDLDVRRNAVRALGEIPGTASVEALVSALHDTDPEIRRMAAQALGNR